MSGQCSVLGLAQRQRQPEFEASPQEQVDAHEQSERGQTELGCGEEDDSADEINCAPHDSGETITGDNHRCAEVRESGEDEVEPEDDPDAMDGGPRTGDDEYPSD